MKESQDEAIDQPSGRGAGGHSNVCPPFDERVRKLVRDGGTARSPAPIEEMITTTLEIARDQLSMADLKLINRSIKEMRSSAKIFAPFKHLRKVAVFGSVRTPANSPDYQVAIDFACELVKHGFMLITGGSDGIMGAGAAGRRPRT